MKLRTLTALCLLISTTAMATTGDPGNTIPSDPKSKELALSKIFYSDYDNTVLFVDFEATHSNLVQLSIKKGEQTILEEDVSQLPTSTIFEINFVDLNQGTYTLELKTIEGISVHKDFVIN